MHLFALVHEGRETAVRKVRVTRAVRTELDALFAEQAESFLDNKLDRVAFQGTYSVDESEIFKIDDFELDEAIVDAITNPDESEELELAEAPLKLISLFSGEYDEDAEKVTAYFQAFTRSRLIRTGWTLLQRGNTFQKLDDPGVTLDTKLVVAFQDGSLFFKKYLTANRIIDITEYFREANDEEIKEVLGHDRLLVEDVEAVLEICDGWMRKRFSFLMESNVLDEVGPRKIANAAKKYDLKFSTSRGRNGDQLVFPEEKKQMKEMLTFLNEGYYEGELTGTKYRTNSNRSVDTEA